LFAFGQPVKSNTERKTGCPDQKATRSEKLAALETPLPDNPL
jgi:hypothetical protein